MSIEYRTIYIYGSTFSADINTQAENITFWATASPSLSAVNWP
jgi:hypothetical protein